jgi:hypothetical protein
VIISPTARPGVHWIRFSNPQGATELKPFVVGLVPEISETEPNNQTTEATAVTLPSATINGAFEKGRDVDTYAVQLTKGQTLVASLQGNEILGSPMDAVLQVASIKGTVLAQNNDDLGLDPRLTFVAPSDGTWYVRTFAFPSAPNSTIAFAGGADYVYRLTLSVDAVVEHTTPLVKSSGAVETKLTLHGWNLSTTEVTVPGDKNVLETGVALPVLIPSSDLPVILESQLPADRLLTLPTAVSGQLQQEDEDAFVLNATKSQKISFTVQTRDFYSMLDPVLAVYGPDGKQLKEADDISGENPDAELHLTMPADGQYRVTVRDRFQNSGDRFFYVLRCEETRPTFLVTVKNTAFAVAPDKPVEIPLTIARKHGFSEPVDFRFEGLPEGITAECQRSEKDGDSSKAVTLKLSGTLPQGFQGVVKILGESVESKLVQPAAFAAADGTSIGELWLTIPATAPAEPAAPAEPEPK